MSEWTAGLARAYAACRATHPEDTTLLVVGVEGTLLDDRGEPQPGIADVVRLFQAQPLTRVALLERGPEHQAALDALARDYDLAFDPELGGDLRGDGYRIAAAIVRDPEAASGLADDDTLVLDTATVLAARRRPRPTADHLGPVELIWHRVNQPIVLRQFLASPIKWGEVDVRLDGEGRLVVHHGDLDPATAGDDDLSPADDVFTRFREAGKGLNLDVKDPTALGPTLDAVADHGFPDEDVWVNGRIDQLGEEGLLSVKKRFPGSRLQCPLESLGPFATTMPDLAHQIVARIRGWGVDRFSLAWTHPDTPLLRDRLDEWDLDTNIYAVTDLEQYLAAVLTVPRSLTADFALPEWHYFGRGLGNDGEFHRDPDEAASQPPGIDVA